VAAYREATSEAAVFPEVTWPPCGRRSGGGFEPAEGALALASPRQSPPGSLVADLISDVGHVLVPDVGRQRIEADQVQLVQVYWCLAVDSGVGCPEDDFSGLWG
jgi:hypothetical protein